MSFFGEEATLFAREYVVVEAMRNAWASDVARFFEALHAAVTQQLRAKTPPLTLRSRHSSEYRYWWIDSDDANTECPMLWYPKEYPELIRDQQLHWHAYLELNAMHATGPRQAAWVRSAMTELAKVQGLTVETGASTTYKPLTLIHTWKEDPVRECAAFVVETLDVLRRANLKP